MIDLNLYPELLKCEKERTKIDKECEKIARKEKRENGGELTLTRHLQISKPVKDYQNTQYAQAIFNIMKEINPKIIEHRTMKTFKFKEIFGNDFYKLNEYIRGTIYQMTLENSEEYKYLDDIKLIDGALNKGGKYKREVSPGYETPIYRNGEVIEYEYSYGLPYGIYKNTPYEKLKSYYEKWDAMSDREQAEYMNKTYGFKYNLKKFSNEKPLEN